MKKETRQEFYYEQKIFDKKVYAVYFEAAKKFDLKIFV